MNGGKYYYFFCILYYFENLYLYSILVGGKERSYVTLQVYLNHPQKGGATTFFSVYNKK